MVVASVIIAAIAVAVIVAIIVILWLLFRHRKSAREKRTEREEELEKEITKATGKEEKAEEEEEFEYSRLTSDAEKLKNMFANPYVKANVENMLGVIERFQKEDIEHEEADFSELVEFWHEIVKTIKGSLRGRAPSKEAEKVIMDIDKHLKALREKLREEEEWEVKKKILTKKLLFAEKAD